MDKLPCVFIFASPHKNGSCAKIMRSFTDMINVPLSIRHYDAYKLSASPCMDCGYCKTQERCALRDLDDLYSAIEDCKLLVIVSPVYNMSFPSPMKSILDRFQRYYNARFSLGIKPAIKNHRKAVLLAAAGSEKETGEVMISQLKQSFSVMNTELCTCAVLNGLDKNAFDENDERLFSCARQLNNIISTSCH